MEAFVQGWGLTLAYCGGIGLVFLIAILHLGNELRWVRALTDHLGIEVVSDRHRDERAPGGLELLAIRDEAHAITTAKDPAWALKQVRSWQMRAQRLEQALAFWTDLVRQLGLLGTVLGIGMSLAYTGSDVTRLLAPLAFKVWTTVAGLAFGLCLTSIYGMRVPAWVDACEKNIEAWEARRHVAREAA
jgi:hypothetical protein